MKPLIFSFVLLFVVNVNAQILDDVRELTELNLPDQTDAYPYLTDDGLRLYFTNNNGGSNNIYFTSRPNLTSNFGWRALIDFDLFDGAISCWFTVDELTAYYSTSTDLFYVTRATPASAFGVPIQITLTGGIASFFGGLSLTPGGEELYIYTGNELSKYAYVNDTTYAFVAEEVPPVGYEGATGQLSKDGLELCWSLSPIGVDSMYLFQLDRVAIGDDFGNPVMLNNLINASTRMNSQATYAKSANVLIWVRNDDGTWDDNDLFIAQDGSLSIFELTNAPKELVKIVDLMGRETVYTPNTVLIYVYNDGTSERVFKLD
ncbi:MAG: hypothetical protein ACI837_001472 [Crocinitomicaceae bacterium]|jgi:hypothetical protein